MSMSAKRQLRVGLRVVFRLICVVTLYQCLRSIGNDLYVLFFDPYDRLLKYRQRRERLGRGSWWR